MAVERSVESWTLTIWLMNLDSLRLRKELNGLGEWCHLVLYTGENICFQMGQAQQRSTATVSRWLSGLWQFFCSRQQPGMAQEIFYVYPPSKTALYPCIVHLGPCLIFTMSSQEERGNEKKIFMGTSLWNVTVSENYLRLHAKYIWILKDLWYGRKEPLLAYLSTKTNNVFYAVRIKWTWLYIDRSIDLLSVISILIKMPVSVNTRELLLDLHFSVSIPLDYTLFLGCQRILFVPPVSTVCVTLEVLSTSTK